MILGLRPSIAHLLGFTAFFLLVQTILYFADIKTLLNATSTRGIQTQDFSILHLVHTRFMQTQGHLLMLARARLLLFETFCLPTMVHQSNQNFFWIITADPDLLPEIHEKMVELLQPYPNFYLVATNNNSYSEDWEHVLQESEIFTGDLQKLERATLYYSNDGGQNNTPTLVETRLDADDGLRHDFVAQIRGTVRNLTTSGSSVDWFYWCARFGSALEWRPSVTVSQGTLYAPQDEPINRKFCITAGLTVMKRGNATQVPSGNHMKLYDRILQNGGCGKRKCIQFYKEVYVIRTRTWTSAGMAHVLTDKNDNATLNHLEGFHVEAEMLRESNQFLFENKKGIAEDNLAGQCRKDGHFSCKQSAKKDLKKLINDE